MALIEDKSQRRRSRIDNSLYTGWALTRVYNCPVGSLDTDIATLTIGRVLPENEGGVSTSNVGAPRLASVGAPKDMPGGQVRISATYISIDVTGTAGTYNVTTKSGRIQRGQFEETTQVIAITTATDNASIPVIGYTSAGVVATTLASPVCRSVSVNDKWEAGRVLVLAEFARVKGYSEA